MTPAMDSKGAVSPLRVVLLIAFILFLTASPIASVEGSSTVSGFILDEEGAPLEGASASLWYGRGLIDVVETDADGRFELQFLDDRQYSLILFADDLSTPGVDHLPVRVDDLPDAELIVNLKPAASLIVEGDIQFVESEELPTEVIYSTLDPSSGQVILRDGFPLIFGASGESSSKFVNLEPNHLLIPANEGVVVEVNVSILFGAGLDIRTIKIEQGGVGQGALVARDVRPFSVQYNIETVEGVLASVRGRLDEMESYGFYMVSERAVVVAAETFLSDSVELLSEGLYVDSFGDCKRSYLLAWETRSHLISMLNDAMYSVYIIVVFLALASTTVAFLLANRDVTKVLGGVGLFILAIMVLYLSYPGSMILSPTRFIGVSVGSIGASLFIATIFPRFMKGRERNGQVPLSNIVVPVFSMAKRSIKRRRLKFILTLISLSVLVMSFVTLTSFSEGYGIITRKTLNRPPDGLGVLIRAQDYDDLEPTFLSDRDLSSNWLQRQPETLVVSLKAESKPQERPWTRLGGQPIHGFLGVDAAVEEELTGVGSNLVRGRLPLEGEVAISETLLTVLDVEVGDSLVIMGLDLTLVGVLDDEGLRKMGEIDGRTFLPGKIVNLTPEEETPYYVWEPCEPSEVAFLHISDALRIPIVRISRVSMKLVEGVDAPEFAERLALERGYWAWSASVDGVILARLGRYLEGKGLPLLVPWGIVVLNVVVTVLNSMYERKKEIHILSSVGLNPSQISAIFVAEALILGLTAGGIGYLLGLSFYKVITFLGFTLEVTQKVSAFWSLASIGIAMTAVLAGAYAALRSSVIITPSLLRKWRLVEKEGRSPFEPYDIRIPMRLLPSEIDPFAEFVVASLKRLENDPVKSTSSIKLARKTAEANVEITFIYKASGTTAGNFYTKNVLYISKVDENEAELRLRTFGDREWAHVTGSLIRMYVMRWSTESRRNPASRA